MIAVDGGFLAAALINAIQVQGGANHGGLIQVHLFFLNLVVVMQADVGQRQVLRGVGLTKRRQDFSALVQLWCCRRVFDMTQGLFAIHRGRQGSLVDRSLGRGPGDDRLHDRSSSLTSGGCDGYEVFVCDIPSGIYEAWVQGSAQNLVAVEDSVAGTERVEVGVRTLVGIGPLDVFIGGEIRSC